ncbi:MAG: hypothetical protein ACR2O8_03135 [Rhizobiaceae bacterium]
MTEPTHKTKGVRTNDLSKAGQSAERAKPAVDLSVPSSGRSVLKYVLLSTVALLLVAVVGMGFLVWTLLNNSISNEQLRAELESQLTRLLADGHSASIGDTKIAIGHGGLLAIDASDVKILREGVVNLGVAREVGVKVKPMPLLTGEVVAQSITLRGASLALAALAESPEQEALQPVWPRTFDLEVAMKHVGGLAYEVTQHIADAGLEKISLQDANLVDFDQLGLRSRTARFENLEVSKTSADKPVFTLKGALITEFSNWEIAGNWQAMEQRAGVLDVTLSGVTAKDLLNQAQAKSLNGVLDHELSVRLQMEFDDGGSPKPANVSISIDRGVIPVGKGLHAELLDAVFDLLILPDQNQINIQTSTIRFDGGEASLTGGFRYPRNLENDIVDQPLFEISVDEFTAFGLVGHSRPPKGQLLLQGFVDTLHQTVAIDNVQITTPNGLIKGKASVRLDAASPQIGFELGVDSIPVEEFKQFWPAVLAPKARKWVHENLSGGHLENAWAKGNFPPGLFGKDELYEPENLAAMLPIRGSTLNNPEQLPDIIDVQGHIEVMGNRSNVLLSQGLADLGTAGKLVLAPSTMVMGNYAIPLTPAKLDMHFSGPAAAVAQLASLEPLSYANSLGLKPLDLGGDARARIQAYFLIGQGMHLDDKPWQVDLSTKSLSSKAPVEGRKFSDGDLAIEANPQKATVTGVAKLDGVPVELAVLEHFSDKSKSTSQVKLTLDDADRERMGLDSGGILSGSVAATITKLSNGTQRVEADLQNAKLEFPWIGWAKGKGIPATAKFDLRSTAKLTTLDSFKLSGQGFSANGTFAIDAIGLKSADIKKVMLNRTDDFDVKVNRAGKTYSIELNARRYDGRALIRSLLNAESDSQESSEAIVSVKGRVGELLGFGGQSLIDVNIDFLQRGNTVSRVMIKALAPENAPTSFTLGPVPGGMKTQIVTANAGSVLRFLDLYTKARGGTINANLVRDDSQVFRGQVVATNFTVLNEPRLAQLLQKPTPPPDMENGEEVVRSLQEIRTDRAEVDQLQARVEKGSGFLNISEGRLTGGDASAAFDGTIYDRNNRMNITGTYLPGRGLNRMVSRIPLIGLAFGRGKVNGLLGITFRLSGRYENPTLQVNPLSIIAPGVFRQMFKFQ